MASKAVSDPKSFSVAHLQQPKLSLMSFILIGLALPVILSLSMITLFFFLLFAPFAFAFAALFIFPVAILMFFFSVFVKPVLSKLEINKNLSEVDLLKLSEDAFEGVRKLPIFTRKWLCDKEPKALVFLAHGYGEHCGRYVHVAEAFNAAGFSVYALDFQGHGQSGGSRGQYQELEDLVDDLITYVIKIKEKNPNKPAFLLGHSMGGLIVTKVVLKRPDLFSGFMLSSPCLKLYGSWADKKAAYLLGPRVPGLPVASVDPKHVSKDPKEVQKYVEDPLNYHGKVTLGVAYQLLHGIDTSSKHFEEIELPFLLAQAGEDKLVDPKGSQSLYEKASSKDKTLKVYDKFYHELFNEPGRQEVLTLFVDWLTQHTL